MEVVVGDDGIRRAGREPGAFLEHDTDVGGDLDPGIVGVFVGVAASLSAAAGVSWGWSTLAERGRTVLLAYAAFGLTLVLLAALSYVNVPGADAFLGLPVNLVIAAVVAVAAAIGRWQTRRPSPTL